MDPGRLGGRRRAIIEHNKQDLFIFNVRRIRLIPPFGKQKEREANVNIRGFLLKFLAEIISYRSLGSCGEMKRRDIRQVRRELVLVYVTGKTDYVRLYLSHPGQCKVETLCSSATSSKSKLGISHPTFILIPSPHASPPYAPDRFCLVFVWVFLFSCTCGLELGPCYLCFVSSLPRSIPTLIPILYLTYT